MISVSRSLDYEQIPNGLIYLTVMAKDAGNPPLYSTVPVTIEVFVSIQLTGLTLPGWGMLLRVPEALPQPSGKGPCPHRWTCPKSCSPSIALLLQSLLPV